MIFITCPDNHEYKILSKPLCTSFKFDISFGWNWKFSYVITKQIFQLRSRVYGMNKKENNEHLSINYPLKSLRVSETHWKFTESDNIGQPTQNLVHNGITTKCENVESLLRLPHVLTNRLKKKKLSITFLQYFNTSP